MTDHLEQPPGGPTPQPQESIEAVPAAPSPAALPADPERPPAAGPPVDSTAQTRPELARLAAAVAELDELDGLPVREQVARYDALHGELSEALASIDEV